VSIRSQAFGLGVGLHAVVRPAFELRVVEIEVAGERRSDVDDAGMCAATQYVEKFFRHQVVADDIGGEGELDAIDAGLPLRGENAGVVHEHIEAVVAFRELASELVDRDRTGCIEQDHRRFDCTCLAGDLLGGFARRA
jgi:hypothetical protein